MRADAVRRFLFEHHPIRGHWVRLERAWQDLRAHQHYPPPVRALLGEATGAAALLASALKFDGLLTLQMQGSGAVGLLVAQCTQDFRLRSVARFDAAAVSEDFRDLAGTGHLTVTVESAAQARYQGIVSILGDSLSACLESYFASSEQLPTVVRLAADAGHAAGLLLQKVAGEGGRGAADRALTSLEGPATEEVWRRAVRAVGGLGAGPLLKLDAEALLRRSLPEEDLRLFKGAAVRFECRCSERRVEGILRSLGAEESRSILAEQGAVTVTCEFCQRPYTFDAVDIERLFAAGLASERPQRLN
ncbi:MAG: Hsp33 family molecular chaperone HslO [Steroidobacteraceae bacterium]